ncbi:MAG: hypothetical protein ACJ79S_09905 [Gemmatimonadaceae bacterium]
MHARAARTTNGRRLAAAVVLPAAALALACGEGRKPARADALNDDLRHDLELASSAGIELAGAPRNGSLQVVSAIEQTEGSVPVKATRTATPHASGRRRHAPKPKAIEPAPAPEPEVQEGVTTVAESGQAPEEPKPAVTEPAPEPATAPAPVVIDGGSGEDRRHGGGGIGTAIGTVIGVVIRGAVVGGVDPCDERVERGRRRGGISEMPMPLPLPLPGNGGDFPRRVGTFPRY